MEERLFETIVEKVCSTKNLQTAVKELQSLLASQTDVEGVLLGHHAKHSQKVHTLVYANSSRCYDLNYTQPACNELHSYLLSDNRQELNMLPRLNDFPALAVTLDSHIPTNHSFYEFRVRLDGEHIGMLGFHTSKSNLCAATLDLLMKVRGPIALNLARRLDELQLWPHSQGNTGIAGSQQFTHIACNSAAMRSVYRVLNAAAPTASTVLLTGETGVGKDVFARHLHSLSPRRDKPFVHVNCGSLPESLIESEFFGHSKGAFTGALDNRAGFFEQANRGTIFLDEIGELPFNMQTRLLQVLQDKSIRRVGDGRVIPLDFRVVAATNCDLEKMCREGRFRRDLFFRLNCIRLEIPPLRERREDILSLAESMLLKIASESGMSNSPDITAMDKSRLIQHDWPGNVRELENCLQRSAVLSSGGPFHIDLTSEPVCIKPDHPCICSTAAMGADSNNFSLPGGSPESLSLQESTRQHLEKVLYITRGRIHGEGGAAEMLGINPSTLRSRLKKMGIPFGRRESKRYCR